MGMKVKLFNDSTNEEIKQISLGTVPAKLDYMNVDGVRHIVRNVEYFDDNHAEVRIYKPEKGI